jgi:single-strand DNA-binding protein
MANLNKVMLIGRLTRNPEAIAGGKGAKFGFAVNNRRLNSESGNWEDVPVFIDMEIWNRGENSRQADRFLETVRQGQQVFIEGHLRLDTWEDRNGGGKRSKLVVVVENFQYLERREGDAGRGESAPVSSGRSSAMNRAPTPPRSGGAPARPAPANSYEDESEEHSSGVSGRGSSSQENEDDIPF